MKHVLPYVFTFFNTNRPMLLVCSILLALATGFWVASSNGKLKTDQAPKKIVSLQLAKDVTKANAIVQSWREKEVIHTAVTSILQDFAFILTYVVAALFLIMAFDKGFTLNIATKIFSWIAITAGIGDTIENIFSLLFIKGKIKSNILIFYPAATKYICIGIFLLYAAFLILKLLWYIITHFRTFFESIHVAPAGYVLKSIKMYLAGLITVIFSYFIFIQITIGQDIIVQITEYWGPFLWSLICIPLWSVLCWYSSRLVGYERLLQPGTGIPAEFHSHMPRLIAFNALVSIQAAMLALPTVGNLTEGAVWAFIIVQNLLYYFWHRILTSSRSPFGYVGVSSIIVTAYITAMIYLVFIGVYKHQKMLPIGALVLFVFQMWLTRWFVKRRRSIGSNPSGVLSVGYVGISKLSKWVRVPEYVRDKEQPLFRAFFFIAVAGVSLFTAANIFPYLADHMGPLPLVLLGLTVIVILANISTILSIHKGINVFLVVLIWAFIMGKVYDPYEVRVTDKVDRAKLERPKMEKYVESWINQRQTIIQESDSFPVYLVIADGGASRSGYWVASVLSKIEQLSDSCRDGNTFSDHLMVLAGASGGSLGNATFYALLKQDSAHNTDYLDRTRQFLKQDFISPVISHWLGADMLNHLFPFHFDDRATALEKSMEYHGREVMEDVFAKPFSEVMDTSGRLPMFFINTTNVQEGAPAVISTVALDTLYTRRIDVLDIAHKLDSAKPADLRYSTAVVMGARFPYVSPAGNLGNRSFVDGGYFDNTGAGILHEMLQHLRDKMKSGELNVSDSLLSKLRFQLIYIRNSSLKTRSLSPMHPLVNDFSAPIVTVLGTYGSQTDVNNARLKNFMKNFSPGVESVDINLYIDKDEQEFPLNWVISKYNLDRMDNNLERQLKNLKLYPIQRRKDASCNKPK